MKSLNQKLKINRFSFFVFLYLSLFILKILFYSESVNASSRYIDPIFSNVSIQRDIVYSVIEGQVLKLDIYQPQGDTVSNRPAILFFHAGGFSGGSKEDISNLATEFAKRGYVTLSVNYRLGEIDYSGKLDPANLSKVSVIMNAQKDAQVAVRWLRANSAKYNVNKDKIFASGGSAGAVIALLLNYNSEFAPSDREYKDQSAKITAASAIMGVASYNMVQSGEPPVIMFNGGMDELILPKWVYPFQDKINGLGIDHSFNWYPDAKHGSIPLSEIIPKMASYFSKFLNLAVKYDLNGDGKVDMVDIGIIINYYGQRNPVNPSVDINKDGYVNVVDIGIMIVNYVF